jgi:hypothetical protein
MSLNSHGAHFPTKRESSMENEQLKEEAVSVPATASKTANMIVICFA